MQFADAAFIGITRVDSDRDHHLYNEWHQLDHRPENLLLDGVAWGERWVRSPECARAATVASDAWSDFHYLNSYWFKRPVGRSIAEWAELADRSYQWGRRPELAVAGRPFMSFFRPVLGLSAPRVLVSPQALPFRPNRGVYLTVSRSDAVADRDRAELQDRYAWYARSGFPQMLEAEGVAGVWAFSGAADLAPSSWVQQEAGQGRVGAETLRVHLYFCDGDPVALAEQIASVGVNGTVLAPGGEVEELLFAGPLRAIVPWQWDWFDAEQP